LSPIEYIIVVIFTSTFLFSP